MEKLFFKKENVCNTYRLNKKIIRSKDVKEDIYMLGSFLESHVFDRPEFYLDWILDSDSEYDCTGGDAYYIYRLGDIILLTYEWEDYETAKDKAKYTLPYSEMVKILKTWKELVADKNSPAYLTIEADNKKFTLIATNEVPEELK